MFEHILVPLDGSELAECTLPHAAALAQALDCRITLLHVLDRQSREGNRVHCIDPLDWAFCKAEARAYLDEVEAQLQGTELQTETVLLEGRSAENIVQFARGQNVDLVVISTHGQSGLSGWNVSQVVQKVLMRAHRSIMLVRAYQSTSTALDRLENQGYRRLLLLLDGSQRAEHALPLASKLAQDFAATLVVAHAICRPEMPRHLPLAPQDQQLIEQLTERNEKMIGQYFQKLRSQLPDDTEYHVIVGDDVVSTLHELAETEAIDLVLLTAHGYSGSTDWPYGSVATSFILYSNKPLLIIQDLAPDELRPTHAEVAAQASGGRPPMHATAPARELA